MTKLKKKPKKTNINDLVKECLNESTEQKLPSQTDARLGKCHKGSFNLFMRMHGPYVHAVNNRELGGKEMVRDHKVSPHNNFCVRKAIYIP